MAHTPFDRRPVRRVRTAAVLTTAAVIGLLGCSNDDAEPSPACEGADVAPTVELSVDDTATPLRLVTYRYPDCDIEIDHANVTDGADPVVVAAGSVVATPPEGFTARVGTSTGDGLKPPAQIEFATGDSGDVASGDRVYVEITGADGRYGLYTALAQ